MYYCCEITQVFHCSSYGRGFLGSVNQWEVKSHLITVPESFRLLSIKCHVHRTGSNFRKNKETRITQRKQEN